MPLVYEVEEGVHRGRLVGALLDLATVVLTKCARRSRFSVELIITAFPHTRLCLPPDRVCSARITGAPMRCARSRRGFSQDRRPRPFLMAQCAGMMTATGFPTATLACKWCDQVSPQMSTLTDAPSMPMRRSPAPSLQRSSSSPIWRPSPADVAICLRRVGSFAFGRLTTMRNG